MHKTITCDIHEAESILNEHSDYELISTCFIGGMSIMLFMCAIDKGKAIKKPLENKGNITTTESLIKKQYKKMSNKKGRAYNDITI